MTLSLRRRTVAWCIAALGVLIAGCTDEPVRVYEAPRDKQRLLGAIIPAGDDTWFFKLMGRADSTAENADAFWKFVRSVRIPKEGKEAIAWTVPHGWKQEPGNELRYATFRIPLGQEVTVFRFGEQPEKAFENINRWRTQLKLPPMSVSDLDTIKKEDVDGHMSFFIDLESARTDAIDVESYKPRPKQADGPDGVDSLNYQVPEGWKEMKRTPGRMFRYGFRVEDAANSAEITLTPFPGVAGGIGANVNRWREELGLSVLPIDEAKKEGQAIVVDDIKAVYVDYSGTNHRTGKAARTLGVICPHKTEAWFIKMIGAPELVAKQQSAFELFVRSIHFGGGK
jgi:hypothetical protein